MLSVDFNVDSVERTILTLPNSRGQAEDDLMDLTENTVHLLDHPPDAADNTRKRSSHNIDIDDEVEIEDGPLIRNSRKLRASGSIDIEVEPSNVPRPTSMSKQKPSWKNFAMLLALCTGKILSSLFNQLRFLPRNPHGACFRDYSVSSEGTGIEHSHVRFHWPLYTSEPALQLQVVMVTTGGFHL